MRSDRSPLGTVLAVLAVSLAALLPASVSWAGATPDNVPAGTAAERAKQIERSGEFRPDAKGELFFTPDRYGSASEAQRWLALPTKPEVYFDVPVSRIPGGLPGATRVDPHFGQPGGGLECVVRCPVSAGGLRARGIGE